ncbi:MAG: TIGR03808 family TAT-translocated repetitive protein, partial [Hyphomicrobiaceae bacterium]
MQLDRRRLVSAGIGLTVLAASVPAEAKNQARARAMPAELVPRPDSGRDETARLQAAIDHAARLAQPLVLPVGRYIVRSLELRNGSHIVGAGPSTVLQHAGSAPLLMGDGATGITLEHLTIKGAFPLEPSWRGLVEFRRASRLVIRDLDIETSPANGLVLERCGGLVTGCRITGAAKAGLFSLDAEGGLEISHNHIAGHGNNGILVWRSSPGEDGTIVA